MIKDQRHDIRRPIPLDVYTGDDAPKLKFFINPSRFRGTGQYEYFLVSLDKMRYKLHLMSKYGFVDNDDLPINVETNLNISHVINDINFDDEDELGPIWNTVNNVIEAHGVFTPNQVEDVEVKPDEDVLYFTEAGDSPSIRPMSDFVLIIRPVQ